MARETKTLARKLKKEGKDGFVHREHRSKKNRKIRIGSKAAKDYKRRKSELILYGRKLGGKII